MKIFLKNALNHLGFCTMFLLLAFVLGSFFIAKGDTIIPRQGPGNPGPPPGQGGNVLQIPPAGNQGGLPPSGTQGGCNPPNCLEIPPGGFTTNPPSTPPAGGGGGGSEVVPVFVVGPLPLPVWVVAFNACTAYEISLTQSLADLFAQKQKAERNTQMQDIQKAREDVNKLVATVYNELRTQQLVNNPDPISPDLRDVLQSVGIAVDDNNTDEMCKASYYVKAKVGGQDQCVAVAQEARIITNQDDYIYEEGRRRAMDALFCYLGEWRHFPIASVNDPTNCEQLGLKSNCNDDEIWQTLGKKLGTPLTDVDGTVSPTIWDDDQSIFNLCEGMRSLGLKCAQDEIRDYIKYSTIDKMTRKDRTVVLAPPQTWYTPARCNIIDAFLPTHEQYFNKPGQETPYTKIIKSLDALHTKENAKNSCELTNILFGSKFGNPSLCKAPSDMPPAEYTVTKELQGTNVPENNFSGLASKTEQLANQIINDITELRKFQYTSGEGLRDATLRIGWQDYEWKGAVGSDGIGYLGKYEALDLVAQGSIDPQHPNKIFKSLPCYWGTEESTAHGCWSIPAGDSSNPAPTPNGKTFYFDTGIVIAPISITKDKLQSAIQAQFDLAAKAFDDTKAQAFKANCGAFANGSTGKILPAPWEDEKVNLSTAINPLTGEPYTYGTPGKNNPPFRIPGINNNYFNFFYNDVFQLYHTTFPDVLAGWFRLNTPAYDSIYGPLKQPIEFSANGDPGSGPPGGLGPGGGSGRGGSGGGKCEPITDPSNPCAVENLQATCFGPNAQNASIVCNVESGGNPLIPSGVDICQPSGPPASWGLFQINISANDINGLNCAPPPHPSAFTQSYTGSNHQCGIEDQELFSQCRTAATDANINIQKACQMSANGTNWGPWRNTANKCGIH